MKAIVTIHNARPPHRLTMELPSALQVDRLLTATGKGKFAFDIPSNLATVTAATNVFGLGDLVAIRSTVLGVEDYVGVITQMEERAAAGVLEISGDNFASVLYGIALDRSVSYSNRGAGEIARQLARLAQSSGRSIFLREGVLRGEPLYSFTAPIAFGTQHLGAALDALAKRTGDEWWIAHRANRTTLEHTLHWRRRRGLDRSRQVWLEEGRDFSVIDYKRDTLGQVRSVTAVGGGANVNTRPTVAVTPNATSAFEKADQVNAPLTASIPLSPLGARDEIEYRVNDTDRTVLASAAQRGYRKPTTYGESLALTVPLRCAGLFGPGDTITARFHSLNRAGAEGVVRAMRVHAIQPDEEAGEADLDVSV